MKSVDEYIARHPGRVQAILRRVRGTIRKALPGAEEGISYQMPTYKLHGDYVVYFAGWKQHYSLYPATDHLVAALGGDLALYEVSKGTIRFPLSEPVPVKLIERIAKALAKEAAERPRAKLAGPRKHEARPLTIDHYLAGLSADKRAALEKVREAISSAAPRRIWGRLAELDGSDQAVRRLSPAARGAGCEAALPRFRAGRRSTRRRE